MVVNADFNSERDLQEVDQVGYVDLAEAFINGAVPSTADVANLSYNDIDDPASISGRPSDVFDAMNASKQLAKVVHERKEANKE